MCTWRCHLPGVKDSNFGRFAGVESLRSLCVPKAVCEDRRAPPAVGEQCHGCMRAAICSFCSCACRYAAKSHRAAHCRAL